MTTLAVLFFPWVMTALHTPLAITLTVWTLGGGGIWLLWLVLSWGDRRMARRQGVGPLGGGGL
jgi:hypothetical protein